MTHFEKGILHDLEEVITEEELISHSKHKQSECVLLLIRNILVLTAAILFILALIWEHTSLLKGIAYFFGAGGYITELLLLTDCFRDKLHHEELFMAYCFGPLYILMGLSYLFGH